MMTDHCFPPGVLKSSFQSLPSEASRRWRVTPDLKISDKLYKSLTMSLESILTMYVSDHKHCTLSKDKTNALLYFCIHVFINFINKKYGHMM